MTTRSSKTITVLIDSREKENRLLFPETLALWAIRGAGRKPTATIVRIKEVEQTLDAGDYCLLGDESLAIVETKFDIGELILNTLTADRPRFLRALERLASSCKFPYLYVHRLPLPWWRDGANCNLEVVQAIDLLMHHLARLNIRLWWGNNTSPLIRSRRRVGELILRILLAHRMEN